MTLQTEATGRRTQADDLRTLADSLRTSYTVRGRTGEGPSVVDGRYGDCAGTAPPGPLTRTARTP